MLLITASAVFYLLGSLIHSSLVYRLRNIQCNLLTNWYPAHERYKEKWIITVNSNFNSCKKNLNN